MAQRSRILKANEKGSDAVIDISVVEVEEVVRPRADPPGKAWSVVSYSLPDGTQLNSTRGSLYDLDSGREFTLIKEDDE